MPRFALTLRLPALLALAIVPAVAALLFVQNEVSQDRADHAAASVVAQAQVLAADVATMVDDVREVGQTLAGADGARVFDGDCAAQLAALREKLASYALIELTDSRGASLCASGAAAGPQIAARVVAAIAAGQTQVGLYTPFDGGRGEPAGAMLPVIVPLSFGGRPGALVVGIDLRWIEQQFAHFHIAPDTSLVLADQEGTILLRYPDPQHWAGRQIAPDGMRRLKETSMVTGKITSVDGKTRLVSTVPPAASGGIYVSYGVYLPGLLNGIDQATAHALWLISVAGLLSLGLLILVARRFATAPAEALLAAAQRWARGDFAARAEPRVPAFTEFGRIAAAFNAMAETLDARKRQLEQLNESLEAKVADRTRILSETNNRLQYEMAERSRTDAALREAQTLQAVGRLAGGMAHEFNNLLASITGALELIGRRLGPADPLQASLGPAVTAARRGGWLTAQLLAFAPGRQLAPAPVDLNAVLDEIRAPIAETLGPAITLSIDMAEDLWPALADRHEIEAAILNLCVNAREAMPEGGALCLATRNRASHEGAAGSEAGSVELRVEDTGIGMSEEARARAIDPFFTTKAPGQGAGLGLSQAHGLARELGGDLRIESREGAGTMITLSLPRALAHLDTGAVTRRAEARRASSHVAREGASVGAEGPRVLLVDDDRDVRLIAAEMLTELGYDVAAVAGGQDALAALAAAPAEKPFTAMVADYAMPGITGLALIGQAQTRYPALRCLLVTGFLDINGDESGVCLAPSQILRKPFTMGELAERLALLTARRSEPA